MNSFKVIFLGWIGCLLRRVKCSERASLASPAVSYPLLQKRFPLCFAAKAFSVMLDTVVPFVSMLEYPWIFIASFYYSAVFWHLVYHSSEPLLINAL